MTVSRVNLSLSDRQAYLTEHLPYRLNCLGAWDLYVASRTAITFDSEKPSLKCYWESHFLNPAFEVGIVFGRSLLNFLGIKRGSRGLENFDSCQIGDTDRDTVFIWHVNPDKSYYPIHKISAADQAHLINLIKVANKSVAHLTTKTSQRRELESLEPARKIIYTIVLEYVDGLDVSKLWRYPW